MANQYEADPRQAEFLKNYLDPKSKTFSNAYQSALKAGYEEKYAQVILSKDLDWLSDNVKTENLLNKALKNLEEFLEDNSDRRIKADMTKFVVSRRGKDRGWSERTELTGKDGQDLTINLINYGNSDTLQVPTEKISTQISSGNGQGDKESNIVLES